MKRRSGGSGDRFGEIWRTQCVCVCGGGGGGGGEVVVWWGGWTLEGNFLMHAHAP